ncbi:hypothetical protein CLOSYM_01878, partial [[Clostridium] symbiosum ATCC 14940]
NVAAFEKIQGTVNDTVQNVNQAAEDSASASHNAQAAVDSIQTAIATATEKAAAAATSATQAAGSQAAADSSKTAAAQSETNAAASAAEARQIAEGFGGFDGTAASVTATDTYGLVVAALGESTTQALIDAIANKVINELVAKSQIINNLLATVPGNALDAVQGKKLMDLYTRLNGEMKQNSFDLENKSAEQTDLNAIYSGVHRYSNRSKNIPSANNGYIIAVKRDSSMLGQIALDDSGTLYSRACVDSSWGSWK